MVAHQLRTCVSYTTGEQIALDQLDQMTNAEWIIGEQTQSEVQLDFGNVDAKSSRTNARLSHGILFCKANDLVGKITDLL